MSALKLTLMARKARAESASLLRADPVAIVGLGCRFPGGANDAHSFWSLLRAGRDAVTAVPVDRWSADLFDPDPAAEGRTAAHQGGFIEGIDRFDAAYFGIRPKEAAAMDPQQRIFLEVAVEALEHAGVSTAGLAGSRTGVFVASYFNDYAELQYANPRSIDERTLTGSLHSVLANRLSFLLDLRGPSLSIDTACSSSLVAVHLACESLRSGESDLAIAGGVSLMISSNVMIALSKVGFLAPDGRCKAFDARANGFGRGEGCGVVVLKRLSDAVADRDRVLAVIRGSAVNQDGRSTVLAAPNGLAQQALIREALANARLDAGSIGYVEAHGTGTALGDPIEVEALAATIGTAGSLDEPCHLGTVKANIGHLEAAAGLAGLIKSTLVLQHAEIPPQVHFEKLNPHISFDGTRFSIAKSPVPWRSGNEPRCAGVSGFGVGGTNAHVILEEAPRIPTEPTDVDPAAPQLLAISAKDEEALHELARRWIGHLDDPNVTLATACGMAAQRRTHHEYRFAAVSSTKQDMARRLQAFGRGDVPVEFSSGRVTPGRMSKLAFVFGGQGQQWPRMGMQLMRDEPVFAAELSRIDAEFRALGAISIVEELAAPEGESRLTETMVAQPAIFAFQVGLTALWRSWGIEPDGVVGHSIGELAAMHVAGMLSLPDAARIVWLRASAMQRATGLGAMAAVSLAEPEARELVLAFGGRLSVAAVNGPTSTVLSGELEALQAALRGLEARGLTTRAVPVNYAFHSEQMRPFAAELDAAIGQVSCSAPRCAVYSTVVGERVVPGQVDAGYFGRNVRLPVLFAPAIKAMLDDGFDSFLEISAHPLVTASIGECAVEAGKSVGAFGSLRRGRGERDTLLHACADLYARNRVPDWRPLQGGSAPVVDLPQYPWSHRRFWSAPAPVIGTRGATAPPAVSEGMLGARYSTARGEVFEAQWPDPRLAWLDDHRVGNRVVVAGMVLLRTLLAAARETLRRERLAISDFVIHRPLVLGGSGETTARWQTCAFASDDGRLQLTLSQAVDGPDDATWQVIATGTAATCEDDGAAHAPLDVAVDPPEDASGAVTNLYAKFSSLGVEFGPSFRALRAMHLSDARVDAWLQRPVPAADGLHADAAMLDAALQACVASLGGPGVDPGEVLLPLGVDELRLYQPIPECVRAILAVRRATAGGAVEADISLWSEGGELVGVLEGARLAPAPAGALASIGGEDPWCHQVTWRELPPSAVTIGPVMPGAWLVLADEAGHGVALANGLEARGHRVFLASAGEDLVIDRGTAWFADPAMPQHFRAVLDAVVEQCELPLRGVVHLWSLDLPTLERGSSVAARQDLRRADELGSVSALHALQAALESKADDVCVTFVTCGAQGAEESVSSPQAAALWGLQASIAVEEPDRDVRVLDLDPALPEQGIVQLIDELLATERRPRRIALRGSARYAPQLQRLMNVPPTRPTRLVAGESRTLDALTWRDAGTARPGEGEIRVRVFAAGINFRDVLIALGMYPGPGITLGAEFAGVVDEVGPGVNTLAPGDAVFGYGGDALATHVVVPAEFAARIPRDIVNMEQAAALPAVFLTAMFGLETIAALRRGQSVLIHAAAGGVGMAAVQLAMRAGAVVHATAGSAAKRQLLSELGVAHVYDSRSLDFEVELMRVTGGAGVDVVLNSLAGDFIGASVRVLAQGWVLPRDRQARNPG